VDDEEKWPARYFLFPFGVVVVGYLALRLFMWRPLEASLGIVALGIIWMAWMGLRDTREEDGKRDGLPPHRW